MMENSAAVGGYRPYFDPDFDSLIERINPPRVCIDNDTREDCTLVKVDSANKHGILLEMVQELTDLDLVISKSYISSDGGWFMDVFHVTDQLGNKITDHTLIQYIQKSLAAGRRSGGGKPAGEAQNSAGGVVGTRHLVSEYTMLELTGPDRPGLISEISAVLAELHLQVVSSLAWTHNSRAACIIYATDQLTGKPISDRTRLSQIKEQVEIVVGAHFRANERWHVTLAGPAPGRVHTERRLHQLMHEDRDYEETEDAVAGEGRKKGRMEAQVTIENCEEKGYSVVGIRSRDRPKLLFDTVCTLTDLDYVVFHATVSSHGPALAVQEYFIRRKDGRALETERELRRVSRCLVAAIERRVSHGLRLHICTRNRTGLLSDVTRVLREHSLSLTRAEVGIRGERAVGTFYVTDASGGAVDPKALEPVTKEIGGAMALEVSVSEGWPPIKKTGRSSQGREADESGPMFSLGSLLWSQIVRFSNNFGSIRS